MYGFTDFVCSLNEMEEGMAPTDSRLRPDQRIMEKGDFDKANEEKVCSGLCSVSQVPVTLTDSFLFCTILSLFLFVFKRGF